MKHIYLAFSILIVTLGLTLVSGVYSGYLSKSEMIHFWVYFPQRGSRPTSITVDAGSQGVLKRLFNPWVIALSTHWIVNTDNRPHLIRLELVNCTLPVEWEVSAGIPWNPDNRTFAEPIGPFGQSIPYLGLDWVFHIPPEIRTQRIWYQGGLAVTDANSNETLSFIPITIYGGWGLNP